MKSLVLLLTSISIFLIGLIFKLVPIPGSGIILIIGLALFVVFAAVKYIEKKSPVIRKILIISSIVLLVSLFFAMLSNRYFAEFLIGAVILGLIIFLTTLMFSDKKV